MRLPSPLLDSVHLRLTFYWQRLSAYWHRLQLAVYARGMRGGLKQVLRRVPSVRATTLPAVEIDSQPLQPAAPGRQRILWIDATTPHPDRDSGSLRAFNLMRLLLCEGHALDFMPDDGMDAGQYTRALRALGVGIPARTSSWPAWMSALHTSYDGLIISRYHLAQSLLPLVRYLHPKTRIVLDTVDLHHLREHREAAFRCDPGLRRLAERTKQRELAVIAAADLTWVVSPTETEALSAHLPHVPCLIVPNLHEAAPIATPFEHRSGVLFVGGAVHPPNLDAVHWLLNEIIPKVRQQIPHCRFYLVGEGLSAALPRGLKIPAGVELPGYVPDLTVLLGQCRISIAPLRFGAGVNGKINQAMASRLPVVATRRLGKSLFARNGEDIMLADDAQGLAAAIVQVHEDATLWAHLVRGGLDNIQRHFSFAAARSNLLQSFPANTSS